MRAGISLACALGLWIAGRVCADEPPAPEPGTEQYFSGNALYNKKLYELAAREYSSFIQSYPRHSKVENARYGLALSYFGLDDHRNAEQQLREVVDRGKVGDKDHLNLLRGQCLLKLDNMPEAEKTFMTVVASSKNPGIKAGAVAGLSEALFRQKKWKEAAVQADELLKTDPKSGYVQLVLYQSAYACRELKEPERAIKYMEILGRQTVQEPLQSRAAYLLAECYRETGEPARAAAQYALASQGIAGETGTEVMFRLGLVNFAQEKYDAAIEALGKALKDGLKGDMGEEAQLYLGRAFYEKGEYDKACGRLDGLRRGNSKLAPAAALWLARAFGAQGRQSDAVNVLKDATQRFQNDAIAPDLCFECGNALVAEGKYKDAADAYGRISGWDQWPQGNDALRLHAVCLHQAGDLENSLKQSDAFIAKFKDDKELAQVRFLRAENLYLLNRLDDAAKACKEYAAAYPRDPKADAAMFRLAQSYHKKQMWNEALDAALPLMEKGLKGGSFSQLRFVVGDSFFRLEKWGRAIEILDEFLAEHAGGGGDVRAGSEPNLDAAMMAIAFARQKTGDKAGAAKCLERVTAGGSGSEQAAIALAQRGRLQYESKDYEAARATFDRFLKEHPKSPLRAQVEYYYGWLELSRERPAEAGKHFSVIVTGYAQDPIAPDATLQLGQIQAAEGDHKGAAGTFSHLLNTYRDHPRKELATFSCGVALARAGDHGNAVQYFKSVVEQYPKSEFADRALYEWAWSEKAMNRRNEAAGRYEQLLKDYPGSELCEKVRTELTEFTADDKDLDKVVSELTGVLAGSKDPATREQVLPRLAMVYLRKGDCEESVKLLESWIGEFPDSDSRATILFQAGECRMRLGETVLAREHFRAACEMPKSEIRESAMLRLGETQGLTRRWEESEATYRDFLAAYPASKWLARAEFGIGWAMEKQKKYEEAMSHYRKVGGAGNRRDELGARARFQMGECLFAAKKYDEAIVAFGEVIKDFNNVEGWTSKALLETARVLETKGDREKAEATFREVMRVYPQDNVAVVAKQRLDSLRRTK